VPQWLLGFFDSALRGIGQVMLQNNSYTGLLFLAGVFCSSMLSGWAALLGTTASTATAVLLGADRSQVRAGLFGFNGALAAIALVGCLKPSLLVWGYVVLAAACTTVLMVALQRLMTTWKIPALTAPFVLTTLCFMLACASFGHLNTAHVPPAAAPQEAVNVKGFVTASTVSQGLLTGLAQVLFQANAITGLIFAAGLLINSRLACIAGLLGSFAGLLVAWGMGADESAIRAGAFGFNSVLTALALVGGSFFLNAAAVAYGSLAVVTTAVVFAALSTALEPLGLPALTGPFVLVVWVFLLASPLFLRLRIAGTVS